MIKNKPQKCKALVIIFTLLFYVEAHAAGLKGQQNAFTFERLTTKDGLASNRIQDFCRAKNDFLWIATTSHGVNKFDGSKVFTYEHTDSIPRSISNNSIHCLFEDSHGTMWIGTFDGLNRYVPETDDFDIFRSGTSRAGDISGNEITGMLEDDFGTLWVSTEYNGLNKWDSTNEKFILVHNGMNTGIPTNRITDMALDTSGNIWIVNHTNQIICYQPQQNRSEIYTLEQWQDDHTFKTVCIDNNGNIWVGSFGNGLCRIKPEQAAHFTYYKNESKGLNSVLVRSIIQQDADYLLVGTDEGGINRFNLKTEKFQYITSNTTQPKSLNSNGILSLYMDFEGILWVGTSRGGVNFHNPKDSKFKTYQHLPLDQNSLAYNVVGCFYQDHAGLIWVGTDGGGISIFDPESESFVRHFKKEANSLEGLSGNFIRAIKEDKSHNVWVATWDAGLNMYDRKKDRFIQFQPGKNMNGSIARIWTLWIDKQDRIWIGGHDNGVKILEPGKGIIKHLQAYKKEGKSLSSNSINQIYGDDSNYVWICTNYGLNKYDKRTDSIQVYQDFPDLNIRCFCKDENGGIWLGSVNHGLYQINEKGMLLKIVDKQDGLPDNTIQSIVCDNNYLWLSTNKGLCKYNPRTNSIRIYTEADGLVDDMTFEQSVLKSYTGQLYFGGYSGFNTFQPDSLQDNGFIPNVYLTDFKLFNKSVDYNSNRDIFSSSIFVEDSIHLKWNQSVFTFEYSAINFTHPEQNQYAYKLDGFDQHWNYVGKKQSATYTNINPGKYIFQVKASNNDGIWNEKGTEIHLVISPPWWKTFYAYAGYSTLCLAIILLGIRIIKDRERLKMKYELENEKLARAHELDLMKIKFFTNVSHEFRTPLTLILSPIEKMMREERHSHKKGQLTLVYRNAKRLLALINQLLDFRKMEVGAHKLNLDGGDIVSFCKDIFDSFTDMAESRSIAYTFHSNFNQQNVCFDKEKMEKILNNLISNAFKFTHQSGQIDIRIKINAKQKEGFSHVDLQVKDTGIGIPKEKQHKIFERFFQSDLPHRMINQGSGIGLSITQEFVQLHGGSIEVHSEVNQGSCFTIHLPLKVENPIKDKKEFSNPQILEEYPLKKSAPLESAKSSGNVQILLVDDNEDFRFYLKENLKYQYGIYEASNGEDAWSIALQVMPDLIISDVVMPRMDGYELCTLLKANKRTQHIPVVLLTAKQDQPNQIEGIDRGADEYIGKPFSFEILEAKIKNLIQQRSILREAFQKQIVVKPTDIPISSTDEAFLQKAIQAVEQNIDNPEFSVVEMSQSLGMSRAHLYQKLMSLTEKAPTEFIRHIRLQRAAKLLKGSYLTISEIAYDAGFNNPKLFTRHFKNEYGVTPSKYRK